MDAAGHSREEAQADICRAVADCVIRFRGRLKQHATRPMTSKNILEGAAFDIPTKIQPKDLDWELSCPVKPWLVRPKMFKLPGYWELDWIGTERPPSARTVLYDDGLTELPRQLLEHYARDDVGGAAGPDWHDHPQRFCWPSLCLGRRCHESESECGQQH